MVTFKGINAIEFNKQFKSNEDCTLYLFELKWKDGFRCRNCGFTKSNKGRTRFHLHCKNCAYDETAAGALVEEGDAILNPVNRNQWIYTATQNNATLAGSVITAYALDLPGNKGSLEITF